MASTIQTIETPKRARALDTSGNNHHGQIYSGRALEFDGVTDYFQHNGGTGITGTSLFANGVPWTWACWIYFDSASTSENYFVGNDGQTQPHITFKNSSDDNILRFRDTNADYYTFSTTKLNNNTWYRIVITTDGTSITAYANGVVYGTIAANQANVAADDNFDNTLMEFSGWGAPYESGGTRNQHLQGMMSDGQVWDATWTADDVSYDYLNPESLVLSNGSTSLTESNLKLWYPMQDGHRGQQSYILDASNTGLGDDLITNGDFATAGTPTTSSYSLGWRQSSSSDDGTNITGGELILTHTASSDGNYSRAEATDGSAASFLFVVGTTYKFTYTVSNVVSGSPTLSYWDGDSYNGMEETIGTHTTYFTPTSAGNFIIKSSGASSEIRLSYVSLEPINDKNNATTVFYGDPELSTYLTTEQKADLVDNLDSADDIMVFADAVTDGCDGDLGSEVISVATEAGFTAATNWDAGDGTWVVDGSNSNTAVRTATDITTVSTLTLGSGGTGSATANRWYVIKYDITAMSQYDGAEAAASFQVTFGGDAAQSSSAVGTHRRLVYTTDTSKPILTAGKNTTCTIDNLSIKEAQGWVTRMTSLPVQASAATADNQSMDGTHGLGFANNDTINGEMVFPIKTTPGKTYRVKARSSVGTIKIGLSNNMSISNDKTVTYGTSFSGTTGYSNELQSNGTQAIYVANNVTTDGEIVRFDDLTIQEVGTASGWTDADQQLHIPQTALQSYNELAWFQDNRSVDNPHAVTAHHTDLDPGTTDFTVSCWVFQADKHDDNYMFAKGGGGGSGWHLQTRDDGDIVFAVEDDDGGNNGTRISVENTNNVLPLGKWFHLVGTCDYGSATGLKLYLNGESIATPVDISSLNNPIRNTSTGVKMGSWLPTYAGGVMNGSATEFSIFIGAAFSTAEVNELYNDGKALDATTHSQVANLKGYWRNDGLNTVWKNIHNPGTHDAAFSNGAETMLIPSGVDGSRDSQGFLMNKQRNTSSLNLTASSDDYVDVPVEIQGSDTLAFLGVGNGFSISCWVKMNNTINAAEWIINRNDATDGYRMGVDANEKINFSIEENGNLKTAITGSAITVGTWYHVVGTFNGDPTNDTNGDILLYINGVTGGGTTTNITNDSNDMDASAIVPLTIGLGHTLYANLEIDGVLMYNDVLTQAEVTRNYNATKGSHRN
jgi:hypothetical protein